MTCGDNRMVAVVSQQSLRIYDLDADPAPSSFEFVLPLGDVLDIAFGEYIYLQLANSSLGKLFDFFV